MHTGEAQVEYYEYVLKKKRNVGKERKSMIPKMTKSEEQIMNLLWSSDKPLSCAKIVELSEDKTWKDSYVHSLIKSLMKKDIVKIDSFELITRSYARKFAPKMTYNEYVLLSNFSEEDLHNAEKMTGLIITLLEYSESDLLRYNIKKLTSK
ncbi:MAG: BlaI/MecI/CopY family transcriptional regulator [Ruminococcus sp.]|nr:BlaI/MecI/CopY family transcriptional regulator [Ruminococcus sp.]